MHYLTQYSLVLFWLVQFTLSATISFLVFFRALNLLIIILSTSGVADLLVVSLFALLGYLRRN